jgi:hypothetical protein
MNALDAAGVTARDPDLVLARLHLRLGSLALARAELETLAGRDALDADGLVDLAEARWRTGDIAGAGEAAVAALHEEDGPLLALVVAAEAAASRGRPTEARRLADKAMAAANGSIDTVFAGMPRAVVWPPDAAAPPPSPTTMFDPPRRSSAASQRGARIDETSTDDSAALAAAEVEAIAEAEALMGADADAATIGLWETTDETVGSAADDLLEVAVEPDREPDGSAEPHRDLPAGDVELDLGRAALESNDIDEAAVRLGLVLRVAPALAPAVIDLVDGRTERSLALVRGDAYRLVGHEREAREAYIEAASGASSPLPGPADDTTPGSPAPEWHPSDDQPDHPSEGDPA